jgi:hypothetical protein
MDVYLHPGQRDETYLIYRLSDTQLADLISFLLSSSIPSEETVPIPFRSGRPDSERYGVCNGLDGCYVAPDDRGRKLRHVRSSHCVKHDADARRDCDSWDELLAEVAKSLPMT